MWGADRLELVRKPTVWNVFMPLVTQLNAVSLGAGSPSWQPPDFYLKHLLEEGSKHNENVDHQYTRTAGSHTLTFAIAKFLEKVHPNINPKTQITITKGANQGLISAALGFVNPGDEVVFFDPAFDYFRLHVSLASGKSVGVPLKPRKRHTKEKLLARVEKNGVHCEEEDIWDIDFDEFRKAFTPKTRLFILNSPHNPIGKVFSQDELQKMAQVLHDFPDVVVLEDNVYYGLLFDDLKGKELPKISKIKGMENRTLSVYSAGKLLSATGVKIGWVIGQEHLMVPIRAVHQWNTDCVYNVLQNTVSRSLQLISEPGNDYIVKCADRMSNSRNALVMGLLKSKYDIDLWVPQGGYFILGDISKVEVMEKYKKDKEGKPLTKDWAFAYQTAYEDRVTCIPCTPFYAPQHAQLGQNYVRFAFCHSEQMINEAGKRLGPLQ